VGGLTVVAAGGTNVGYRGAPLARTFAASLEKPKLRILCCTGVGALIRATGATGAVAAGRSDARVVRVIQRILPVTAISCMSTC
jgi:ribose 5-phosphate isomerase RpiB